MTAENATTRSAGGQAGQRERYLDVYRAIALVRVVVYHMFGYAWLSFFFPAMGVMFAVAGSLTARSLERRPGTMVIWSRLRRLLPSLWVLGAIVVPAMLLHSWSARGDADRLPWSDLAYWIVPVLDPPGTEWAANATAPLWYIRAYLWFVLLSPLLLRAFRRWPVATTVAPLVLILGAGLGVPNLDSLGGSGSVLRDFGTYGACWVLGFAHRSGALRRIQMPVAAGLAAVTMAVGLGWALNNAHPGLGYDLNEIPTGQALWSVGVVLVLLRWAPRLDWIDGVPIIGWLVQLITARAVTIYLWHNIAIDLSFPVNNFLGRYSMVEYFITACVLTGVAVLLFGWVEDLAARRPVQLVPGYRRPGASAADAGERAERTRPPLAVQPLRRYLTGALAVLLPIGVVGYAATDEPTPRAYTPVPSWSASAYLVPWDMERGLAAMPDAAKELSSVSPVWYTPKDDGGIVRNSDSGTEPLVSTAQSLGLDIVPSISNFRDGVWDADLVSRLVGDSGTRDAHVQSLMDLVIGQGWEGIDIDYEAIAERDYEAFGGFLSDLAAALHEEGRRLTVAVPAGTSDGGAHLVPLYREVGAVADEVRVMAYDKAWNESAPGPVAPLGWVEDVVEFATAHVPAERVSLGLAAHGYDWDGTRGEDVMWADAKALAKEHGGDARWNERHKVPWFVYTGPDGEEHRVWYENARSLAAKRELATEYGLGGVFVWRLGGADPRTWPQVGFERGRTAASVAD